MKVFLILNTYNFVLLNAHIKLEIHYSDELENRSSQEVNLMAINDIFTIHEINLDIKDLSYDIKAKELETYWNKECSELPIINHCKIFAINTSTFRYSYA